MRPGKHVMSGPAWTRSAATACMLWPAELSNATASCQANQQACRAGVAGRRRRPDSQASRCIGGHDTMVGCSGLWSDHPTTASVRPLAGGGHCAGLRPEGEQALQRAAGSRHAGSVWRALPSSPAAGARSRSQQLPARLQASRSPRSNGRWRPWRRPASSPARWARSLAHPGPSALRPRRAPATALQEFGKTRIYFPNQEAPPENEKEVCALCTRLGPEALAQSLAQAPVPGQEVDQMLAQLHALRETVKMEGEAVQGMQKGEHPGRSCVLAAAPSSQGESAAPRRGAGAAERADGRGG